MTLKKFIKMDKAHSSSNEKKNKSKAKQKNADAQMFQTKHPKDSANAAHDKLIKAKTIQLLEDPQRLKLDRAETPKYETKTKNLATLQAGQDPVQGRGSQHYDVVTS